MSTVADRESFNDRTILHLSNSLLSGQPYDYRSKRKIHIFVRHVSQRNLCIISVRLRREYQAVNMSRLSRCLLCLVIPRVKTVSLEIFAAQVDAKSFIDLAKPGLEMRRLLSAAP